MIPYSKMPPEAEDVMRRIRWWSARNPAGPTMLELRCTCLGHKIAIKRGLKWLKDRRLVTWTNEGQATRYAEAKTKARAAA